MAIPGLLVTTIFSIIVGYAAFNYATCPSSNSFDCIQDKYTRLLNLKKTELHEGLPELYDIPINVVNNILYRGKQWVYYHHH